MQHLITCLVAFLRQRKKLSFHTKPSQKHLHSAHGSHGCIPRFAATHFKDGARDEVAPRTWLGDRRAFFVSLPEFGPWWGYPQFYQKWVRMRHQDRVCLVGTGPQLKKCWRWNKWQKLERIIFQHGDFTHWWSEGHHICFDYLWKVQRPGPLGHLSTKTIMGSVSRCPAGTGLDRRLELVVRFIFHLHHLRSQKKHVLSFNYPKPESHLDGYLGEDLLNYIH